MFQSVSKFFYIKRTLILNFLKREHNEQTSMNETCNWNSVWCFKFSILPNKAFITWGINPVWNPSLKPVPMVYVLPEPVCKSLKCQIQEITTKTSIITFNKQLLGDDKAFLPDHKREQWHYILETNHQPEEQRTLQTSQTRENRHFHKHDRM